MLKAFIFLNIGIFSIQPMQEKTFGKFDLNLTNFALCKGPKVKSCTELGYAIVNRTALRFDVLVKETLTLTKGKVIIKSNGKIFLRLQMKNPCQHLFINSIFSATYNMTKNCVCPKGNYINYFDINNLSQQYYGGSFVYGNITFESTLYSDVCNFACTIIDVTIFPKK